MIKNKITVCKGCEERYIGCHAECQRYIEQRNKNFEENERIYKAKLDEAKVDKFYIDGIRMTRKRQR